MSSSASAPLHGFVSQHSNDPPQYDDVIKMNCLPTVPLLEQTSFSSIFGLATSVQFEWNSSDAGCSFLIRDADGSLQAKGDATDHNTIVQNINGVEMLKIVEREVNEENGTTVHTLNAFHKHALIGTVKVAPKSAPRTSLQITSASGSSIIVNSLIIGDYAIFRGTLSSMPLCNIQMPDVEIYNPTEFNVKLIFHPQTGITQEEQLLCTAAAVAFKTKMKQSMKTVAEDGKFMGYCGGIICAAIFIGLLVLFYVLMEKWGCEHKKASGYSAYQGRRC